METASREVIRFAKINFQYNQKMKKVYTFTREVKRTQRARVYAESRDEAESFLKNWNDEDWDTIDSEDTNPTFQPDK